MTAADYRKEMVFEKPCRSQTQTLGRVGQTVNMAVKRFMSIGEIIAEDHPEIKADMFDCCRDARDAGKSIERLCEYSSVDYMHYGDCGEPLCDQDAIVLAARSLLSSVTRVLLLVDIVVVKKLLTAKKKITKSLEKLESVMNFTEFVRAFSCFGMEMVELAYLAGNQQNVLKEERRRAQMHSARQILERSITILLTSSKTSLVHGDCVIAKENRDTVFCQIRRAMDLIHFVVKDSIFDSTWLGRGSDQHYRYNQNKETVYSTLKHFISVMESFRSSKSKFGKTSSSIPIPIPIGGGNNNCSRLINPLAMDSEYEAGSGSDGYFTGGGGGGGGGVGCGGVGGMHADNTKYDYPWLKISEATTAAPPRYTAEIREQLIVAFERLLEKTHDFTDSAYTSHENRESILLLCDRCKLELNKYLNNFVRNEQYQSLHLLDEGIDGVLNAVKNLSEQLVLSVADQVADLHHSLKATSDLVNQFQPLAIKQEVEQLQECASTYHEYCDHILDVCKLLRHVAFNETLQIQAKCLTINLRIYGPQVVTAAKILSIYPTSDVASENFDAFLEMWKWLSSEIKLLSKKILESAGGTMNIPVEQKFETTPGGIGSNKPGKQYHIPQDEIEKASSYPTAAAAAAATAAGATDAKDEANELNLYDKKWNDDLNDNNDILKRAKNMSAMAFAMYQFTKGNGTLRTTQDLFTQAEHFAEEANRLYKVLRQFSYQVPASENKKDLLNILDRVPTFVQTLQFTVKEHCVGQAATFVKVEHVLRETKNLMSVINKVVTKCFECANKFKLDFTGLSGGITSGSLRGEDNTAGGMGDSKGTTNSTEGSM